MAGQYELSETCGANSTCQNGSCVPDGAVCAPGVTRCVSATQYETCSADGGGYGGRVQCGGDEVCENGQCVSGCNSVIGEKSNIGCQYVSMRLNQANGIRAQGHSVVVSNPGNEVVTVNVTSPGVSNLNMPPQSINPQQSTILNFPVSPMIGEAGVSNQIYVINTSKPVIATQFAPLNNPGVGSETSDASLLLPTNALGNEHIVLNWPGPPSMGDIPFPMPGLGAADTYIDVVAIHDNTSIQVSGPVALSGGSAGSMAANSSQTFSASRHQVLHLSATSGGFGSSANTDLSGTVVTSNQPVAVFVGATLVNIPDAPVASSPATGCVSSGVSCSLNAECCSGICGNDLESGSLKCMDSLKAGDHIEQQLFPTESWGTSYVATPFYSRGVNDFAVYKVTAARNNTVIAIDPPVNGLSSITLNRGQVRQLHAPHAFELEASDAIMVAQFMIGGQTSTLEMGDPAFLLPPAVQQFRDDYVFLVPDQYAMNFVTLIAPTGVDIELDGATVAASTFTPVGGNSAWSYKLVESLAGGVHRASADQPFGVVVHGIDDYISYAFSGGIILPD
ncbi:hypothetical protein DN745_12255 [Bradymonas sediminis]|uniref:IgGFc-binding protein N-terminal domain-containing protein n=1 Tax=Bradymonas sediminis TaxID=1548548 RepID=A0A2Z4FMZ9_9DELT|nr:hypothetical protein DN745_12255 [Bradymonas sediminis]